MKNRLQWVILPLGMVASLGLFALVERRPALFANTNYLGAILAVQIAFVGLAHFEEVFFPLLIGTFLWAGSSLPLFGVAMSLRWLFLGVGALGGFILWVKSPRMRHFDAFHLVAMFCVLSALVSALVSEIPRTALLKVLSLFMLFLYTSSGGRLAIAGREKKFMDGLVFACEILAYLSAACYFVLGFSVFGNPNALGAVIGVVAIPVLLWAALVADSRNLKQRRFLALALCGGLLYQSNSRASILGAVIVVLVFTIALRRQRLLLQFAFVSFFFMTLMAVVNPSHVSELFSSFTGRVVYKVQANGVGGVFESRMSPWTETLSSVKRHPWFGTGFGTDELGELRIEGASSISTVEGTNREHGNSYLAMTEYMGLLGAVPFVVLLLMLLRVLVRIFFWMRRIGNPYDYCIPFALIAITGLVHAFFEDWLFAVGSYLCIFFWFSAFVVTDLAPSPAVERRMPSPKPFPAFAQSQPFRQPTG